MDADQQFPTSFRFTAAELARLDDLAELLYREFYAGRVTVSRKTAVMFAVDEHLQRMREQLDVERLS
jgi:hypothetical protein